MIETTDGSALLSLDAAVTYNSTFNTVRCDMAANPVRFHLYWRPPPPSSDTADTNKVDKGFLFPSEQEHGGAPVSAEIRYTFSSTEQFPLGAATPLGTNALDSRAEVSLSILLRAAPDGEGRLRQRRHSRAAPVPCGGEPTPPLQGRRLAASAQGERALLSQRGPPAGRGVNPAAADGALPRVEAAVAYL